MTLAGIVLCFAYILGLLITTIPGGGYLLLGLGIVATLLARRRFAIPSAIARLLRLPESWQLKWNPKVCIAAGLVGLLASLYFQARIPYPAANDVSKLISSSSVNSEQIVTVQGKVIGSPRLTRSGRSQFWMKATQVSQVIVPAQVANSNQAVSGKLYVTLPLLQGTGLRSGQAIAVTGKLYEPKPAQNPGEFDFRAYLAQEGGFAGLSGRQISLTPGTPIPQWGWWAIRQKIIQTQVRWLGSPEGPLVSSMVLGSRAVDLPYDIRDQFAKIGLAHALAASGFQTSLILGLVLVLTRRFPARMQIISGTGALAIFVGLAGLQPAVLRAALMGFAALVALGTQRKIKPLGSLLVAATFLLLWNPLWIWDLGFQLSLLATLGLLVTVPPVIKRLDWLPPAIATLIAVPIAAYLWTLPLQLYAFGLVSPYSIVVNFLTTPLISIISIGGVISALAALVWPLAGSAIAWLLYYPTHGLIAIVDFFSRLPGNSIAVGTISTLQLAVLYGLICLAWLQTWWQRRWWAAGLIAVGLIVLPVWYSYTTLFRATVLATSGEPILVVQDQSRVGLVNSGNEAIASLTVLPFLQKQGINQIDWAVATDTQHNHQGWSQIVDQLPIKAFYTSAASKVRASDRPPAIASDQKAVVLPSLSAQKHSQLLTSGQTIQIGSTAVQPVSTDLAVWVFKLYDQPWIWLSHLKSSEQNALVESGQLAPAQVLWWTGEPLTNSLLKVIKPQIAIASAASIDPDTLAQLRRNKIEVYWTGRDGALQWQPNQGLTRTLESTENEVPLL
ncbi:ComEC/Rec2 family competence protein [Trichocoleus sp. FACHB-591]|uniref:ComEC/Rec2 family competence protein n=1 Tax=Trichocoleus sp. FACHB-591 TaxID=2692872 RepID=UPI0018EF4085|nr:ComEC/Rec2 family competence protein [Trichocoleus sp. FACHB-591]